MDPFAVIRETVLFVIGIPALIYCLKALNMLGRGGAAGKLFLRHGLFLMFSKLLVAPSEPFPRRRQCSYTCTCPLT